MSKYNLIDIYEQYKIGSGWTRDFDYDGMLKAGLKTGVDTDIELLKKMAEDFEDVNYHREVSHLFRAIEALEEGAIKEASMFFGDFHAEIKKTQGDQGMDMSDDLGAYMASKMDLDEDKEEDRLEAHPDRDKIKAIQAMIAKEKESKNSVKEMTGETFNRIDGLTNQNLKIQFLNKFSEIYEDMVEAGDMFDVSDVIDYLCTEMQAYAVDTKMDVGGMMEEEEIEEDTNLDEGAGKELKMALLDVGTQAEVDQYMDSLRRSKDTFDNIDDYIEDFKEYISNKSLQEHFGRFMKDYQ